MLREEGLSAFTQPRVAARAKLRQSHLTYYFPTRLDLLAGVAEAAMAAQLKNLDEAFVSSDVKIAAGNIADTLMRPERTRVLMALAQSADVEPKLQEAFKGFAAQIAARVSAFLKRLGATTDLESIVFVHAVTVGMSLLLLSQKPKGGNKLAAVVVEKALRTLLERKKS